MKKLNSLSILVILGFAALSGILGLQVYNLQKQVAVATKAAMSMDDKAVATINGESITQAQFYDRIVTLTGQQILDQMIEERLVNQEAKKAGVKLSDADINAEIESLKGKFGIKSDAELRLMLAQNGMTLDDFKQRISHQLVVKRILAPKVSAKVTDLAIREHYEKNKDSYGEPAEVRVRHILVDTEEEARAVLGALQQGEDFGKLAAEKSKDPGSKDKGGDLDFFGRGRMVPQFEEVAFSLAVGQTSAPVKTDFGFHIIQVTDKKEAKVSTLEEVKDQVKEQLLDEELGTLIPEWLTEIRQAAKITNTLEKSQG